MAEQTKEAMAQDFCCWYVKLGNAAEAAKRAGFPPETALRNALDILRQKRYRSLVRKLQLLFAESPVPQILSGLERLAFGSANDAVQLVFSEQCPSPEELAGMDLFNLSEIRRVKGGGVEIKLFDRQKALEKLMDYAGNADSRTAARSLLQALAGVDADAV